jgi:shikimate kinase
VRYFVIGFKSSGKTTIGKRLAAKLHMEFIDLDALIEEMEGKPVTEIFTKEGEEEFRIKEWNALKEAVQKDNIVVSTGGGAPCHCGNMNLMEEYGEVIYLKLDNSILVSRLMHATKDRPIVKNKSKQELEAYINDLRNRCEHHYKRAKYIIDAKDLTVEKLLEYLKKN